MENKIMKLIKFFKNYIKKEKPGDDGTKMIIDNLNEQKLKEITNFSLTDNQLKELPKEFLQIIK